MSVLACGHDPSPSPPSPLTASSAPPGSQPRAGSRLSRVERAAAARITAASVAAPIRYLADDLLEGRAPGTRGDDLAIKYIASELESMGLDRGGDAGGWLQHVPLVGITPSLPKSVELQGANGASLPLTPGTDVVIRPARQERELAFDAPDVVFVGYGIVAPRYQWDDYKDVDVRGKVVLLMNNDPEDDPQLFEGKTRTWYGRWDYKYMEAARHGAVAAILIHTDASAGYPWQVVTSSWSAGEKFDLPAGGEPRSVATMWATDEASRKIAALGGKDLDALRASAQGRGFRPVPLGLRFSLSLRSELREVQSANVIGVLRGRDPRLAGEAVIVSAHHDHLGIGPVRNGDAIYNGAIDNASGVAAMLAIARAAAEAPRTRRSLVFLAVTAEEQGLLGSEWYVRHPTFPLAQVAANLNIDSVNHFGKASDVGYTGYGRTSLDAVVEAIAQVQGRSVHGGAFPERGNFFRSDQFSFARNGIPTIYLRGGPAYVGHTPEWGRAQDEAWTQTHYHQPSDEFDPSWDLTGAVDDAQLLLVAAIRIANAEAMPTWRAGDEFEAMRKLAPKAAK